MRDALRRRARERLALAPGPDHRDRRRRAADEPGRAAPRTASAVTASMRSISSAGSISRSNSSSWRAICSARADELSRPISRPALSCALERASSASAGFSAAARTSSAPTTSISLLHHLRPRRRMDREQPRIGKRPAARVDRVAEAAPLPHLLEQPRRHAAAEQPGEHLGGVELLRRDRTGPANAMHEMALLERLCRGARSADVACRLESTPGAAIEAAELGLSVAHELGRGRRCRRPRAPCARRRSWP